MEDKKLIVDISKWNYPVDFDALKSAGVSGLIIRAGSGNKKDVKLDSYVKDAINYGFDIGFYWFIYIHSGRTISENVVEFEKTIRPYKNYITLKTWCDYEYDTDDKLRDYDGFVFNKTERTQMVLDFCKTMEFYGYQCGVYTNMDYLKNKFVETRLKKIPLWYARYNKLADDNAKKAFMWQFSSKYEIGGRMFDSNYLMEKTFPAITVTQAFNVCGIPSSYEERVNIAIKNGMLGYSGKAEENAELVKLLADGKLKNPFF